MGEVIHNDTGERRVPLTVEVAYAPDVARVLRTAHEVPESNARVLKDPTPEVGIVALGDFGIELALRPWCRVEDCWRVQYEVHRAILVRFRAEQTDIPSPVRDIRMVKPVN